MRQLEIAISIVALLFIIPGIKAQVTFLPSQNAYVSEQYPDSNFVGQGLFLAQQNFGAIVRHSNIYLKFDMNANIGIVFSGHVYLYNDVSNVNLDSVWVYILTGPWLENTLTWNNAIPLLGQCLGKFATDSWVVAMDLPDSLIQSWRNNPTTNYGIMISTQSPLPITHAAHYNDKSSPAVVNAPQLVMNTVWTGPPPTPMVIAGKDTICYADVMGNAQLFYVFPNDWATTYHWISPWPSIQILDHAINCYLSPMDVSGQICVSASNSFGNSDTICKYVVIEHPPFPGNIIGPDSICDGDTVSLTLIPGTPDSAWTWTTSNYWQILSGQGTSSIVMCHIPIFPFSNNIITKVSVKSTCNNPLAAQSHIYVLRQPGNPIITGPDIVSPNSVVDYIAQSFDATSYVWTAPPEATILSGDSTNHISVHFGNASGPLFVRGKNMCDLGMQVFKSINVITGIDDPQTQKGINAYCNEEGILKIMNSSNEQYNITIINVTGALIIKPFNMLAISEKRLDLSPGFYIVKCKSSLVTKSYKLSCSGN